MELKNATSNDVNLPTDWYQETVFKAYAFYVCVLALKMLLMSYLTAFQRITRKAFVNPEDARMNNVTETKLDDPNVERVRRAHQNDIENIYVFWIVGLVYSLTKPNPMIALNLFRVYTATRIIHTIIYAIVVVPQPSRAIAWNIGFIITVYMSIHSAIHFFSVHNI